MRLFGTVYKVTFHENQIDVDPNHDETMYGCMSRTEKYIRLWRPKGMHAAELLKTYLHEVLHAVDFDLGGEVTDEKVIDKLSIGLCSWVQENGIKVRIG